MIDLYFWPTGNGKKILILLEELGLPYTTNRSILAVGTSSLPNF
jgi:GSH-dependent disulfide-bond oxidoreductase